MEAFYAHGSLADLDALDVGLEMQEEIRGSTGAATLFEALLTAYKVSDFVSDDAT
jgi:hypothetical protein